MAPERSGQKARFPAGARNLEHARGATLGGLAKGRGLGRRKRTCGEQSNARPSVLIEDGVHAIAAGDQDGRPSHRELDRTTDRTAERGRRVLVAAGDRAGKGDGRSRRRRGRWDGRRNWRCDRDRAGLLRLRLRFDPWRTRGDGQSDPPCGRRSMRVLSARHESTDLLRQPQRCRPPTATSSGLPVDRLTQADAVADT